jgi:hypothetical protein
MHANTDDLGRAIANQQERMCTDLLYEANSIIVDLRREIADQKDVIRQYAEMAREDAVTIARLRVGRENDAALTRAVAARDAREYAASMRRTAEYQR